MPKIIVGNWKMNPVTLNESKKLFLKIKNSSGQLQKTKVIICPPSVFISDLVRDFKNENINIGSQDCFFYKEGAYTGEISPFMLKSIGASYVILGHSERRSMGEDNSIVGKKVSMAIKSGLKVILCVGEKERDDAGLYLNEIRSQLSESLSDIKKQDLKNVIVAYEPVWSIGVGATRVALPEEVSHVYIFIKKVLAENFDRQSVDKIKVLYGGSVGSKNASDFLFGHSSSDGLLVGRASLDALGFNKILKIAEEGND